MRWGMVIDADKCIGCRGCVVACKAQHGTPPNIFFGDLMQLEVGRGRTTRRVWLPKLCMHCEDPLCIKACPTGASQQRDDGIVWVDQDKCMGCRACIEACPYEVRFYFGKGDQKYYYPEGPTPYELQMEKKWGYKQGTVLKCDLCMDLLDAGGKTACVETCITECRTVGDLDDPDSEVSKLIATRNAIQLKPEAGTSPCVYYIF